MRFLVIGLGSMGKRRIKCLHKLGHKDILGFDTDHEVSVDGIEMVECMKDWDGIDTVIISPPPDAHRQYIDIAIKTLTPAFVEQNVVFDYTPVPREAYIAPSCTMLFHPEIQKLRWKKIVNFSYHVGQYLPDWHDGRFYGYYKPTSACRELVAFELNWITNLLGFPLTIHGSCRQTMEMGANIDDAYAISMDFGHCLGSMTVDVVSRKKTRHLIVNTDSEQIVLDLDIPDQMYVDELKAFIDGVFPNTFDNDIKILKLVEEIENG